MVTQCTSAGLSIVLAVLTLTGGVEVWHVNLIALLFGMVTVIDNPARQAFVGEIVGRRNLANAVSLSTTIFNLGGLIGPAVSGILLVLVGAGWSFAINGVACLAVVTNLILMNPAALKREVPYGPAKGQLRVGLQYAVARPAILWPIIMMGFFAVFGLVMPVLLLAYADQVFVTGAQGYGLFTAVFACGSLLGAAASTMRGPLRVRVVIGAVGLVGVLQLTAGLMHDQIAFCIALVGVGFMSVLALTGANSLIQISCDHGIRGRVMSLYLLVLLGGQAVGSMLTGWTITQFGASVGMVLSGGIPALVAATIAVILARKGKLRLALRPRHPLTLVRIVPKG
jgi:MFS family permease